MNKNLISKAQVKKYTLQRAQELRLGWKTTQVSEQFLYNLNVQVRLMIDRAIRQHPTIGKTVKYFS